MTFSSDWVIYIMSTNQTEISTNSNNVSDSNEDFMPQTDDLSRYLFYLIDLAFSCVLINILAFTGLVCTVLNISILYSSNITTDSSNILLLSLSVADFLFCLTIPISRANCVIEHFNDMTTAPNTDINFLHISTMLSRLFYVISISMTAVISVERFLVVFFPFRTVSLMTPIKIKLVSASVYILNFSFFCPSFFAFKKEWTYDQSLQRFLVSIRPTRFYIENYVALNIELGVFHNNTFLGTSMALMLILTPALAIKLWLVVSERSKLTHRTHTFDPVVAKILMSVCAVNIIFYGPLICFKTVTSTLMPSFYLLSNTYQVFMVITDFSGTLGATVNFVIYFSMSRKFRNKYRYFFAYVCAYKR